MDGSHDFTSLCKVQCQFWRERHAELDTLTARMTEKTLVAIARSRALLDRTHRQVEASSRPFCTLATSDDAFAPDSGARL
jgi:hypothetical protein